LGQSYAGFVKIGRRTFTPRTNQTIPSIQTKKRARFTADTRKIE